MTKIKICGLQTVPHALTAAEAGADYLGMIFSEPSSRRISIDKGIEICSGVREAYQTTDKRTPKLVGVFVNESPDTINSYAEKCGLDLVQLSGDEEPPIYKELEIPIMKAIRIAKGQSYHDILPLFEAWLSQMPVPSPSKCHVEGPKGSLFLVEGKVEGRYGGTGHVMEWSTATQLAVHYRFLLAGGLTPDNVAQAIHQVAPWGVDVSSGVETDGVKDPVKVLTFISKVKEADRVKAE